MGGDGARVRLAPGGEACPEPVERAGALVLEGASEPVAIGLPDHVLLAGASDREMSVRVGVHVHQTRGQRAFFPR